jgi:hypothetical protein
MAVIRCADVIKTIWANVMESTELVGDTESSDGRPCLRAGTTRIVRHVTTRANITHTAAIMTVRLVLVNGKAL